MCEQCKQARLLPEFEAALHPELDKQMPQAPASNRAAAPPNRLQSPFFNWLAGMQAEAPAYTESSLVRAAIARGERNENTLTDLVFHQRHPELGGKPLYAGQPNFSTLSREWVQIRDRQVRPALQTPAVPPPPTAPPAPQPGVPATVQQMRNNMVQIALGERARWEYGRRKEHEPAMQALLTQYWKEGVGFQQFDLRWAWSAAFISWVVSRATGRNKGFKYDSYHTTYTYYAKLARQQNSANLFKAFSITEIKPQPGDILVNNRDGNTYTYENVQPYKEGTHGSIVTKIAGSTAYAIGGNESDSVGETRIGLNTLGFVNMPAFFAIIRIGGI